jgi:transcriptional regulator with GAF, ATPase, and Fis domain
MPVTLVALAGPLQPQVVPIGDAGLTVGRDPSNELHPPDQSLSRRHCTFTLAAGRVTLEDLGSRNGTFINGVPVRMRVLEHGDQVKIGESLFLFLHDEARTSLPIAAEDDFVGNPTAQIRKEDVLHLQSEQMVDAFSSAARGARSLETLLKIARALSESRTADDVRRSLFERLFEVMAADRAAIVRADSGVLDFSTAAASSKSGDAFQVSRTIATRVFADGVALLTNDAASDAALRHAKSVAGGGSRSVLCVPMLRGGRPDGVLYVASTSTSATFGEPDLQLLTAIGGLAALALHTVDEIDRLNEAVTTLRAEAGGDHALVGESAPMRDVRALIAKAAQSSATVLILGESGTGKELAAREIHRLSERARRPFVTINASELAETLLESELFGHEKGAFTGAIAQKKGKLELADGGTLFLDEIGELAPAVQVKLLRVLQERELTRVGGTRAIQIDVRIIAATNRDLEAAVRSGAFRQDLFYRLNVIAVRMPSLRDRPDDVPLLAALFAQRYARKVKRHIVGVAPEARACLTRYEWPGNVRELENAIERAIVLGSTDRVELDDLPETVLESRSTGDAPAGYHDAIQSAKKRIVLEALERASGDYGGAARELGIHPNNLHRLLRNLGLKKDRNHPL